MITDTKYERDDMAQVLSIARSGRMIPLRQSAPDGLNTLQAIMGFDAGSTAAAERPWGAKMEGTLNATAAFNDCIYTIQQTVETARNKEMIWVRWKWNWTGKSPNGLSRKSTRGTASLTRRQKV